MTMERDLIANKFILVPGGEVKIGTKYPLTCSLEGYRKNENGPRIFRVNPFWVNKYCVTNEEFERFDSHHHRPPTAERDHDPVTDVTYSEASRYAEWLSLKIGVSGVTLPTELEWVYVAAPFGWEYPYKKGPKPQGEKAHTYDPERFFTLEVHDDRFGANLFGLYHMEGNVMEITRGWYYATGHDGSETDGAYYIAKGGNFGHCSFSAGVHRRFIIDVIMRSPRIGFRLACPEDI